MRKPERPGIHEPFAGPFGKRSQPMERFKSSLMLVPFGTGTRERFDESLQMRRPECFDYFDSSTQQFGHFKDKIGIVLSQPHEIPIEHFQRKFEKWHKIFDFQKFSTKMVV
jgi:hypothetical protein